MDTGEGEVGGCLRGVARAPLRPAGAAQRPSSPSSRVFSGRAPGRLPRRAADEAVVEAASTADEAVTEAEAASTADETEAEAASTTYETVAEAASTADETMTGTVFMVDEAMTGTASTMDKAVATAWSTMDKAVATGAGAVTARGRRAGAVNTLTLLAASHPFCKDELWRREGRDERGRLRESKLR